MTITYQREPITWALRGECQALLGAHYVEIGPPSWPFLRHIPLEPDWNRYQDLERAGAFHILTARDAKKLIGYACWFVTQNYHYAQIRDAASDIFFIAPEYRGKGRIGLNLFLQSEAMARELGANRMSAHIKLHNGLDVAPRRLLEGLGFVAAEINMWKALGTLPVNPKYHFDEKPE